MIVTYTNICPKIIDEKLFEECRSKYYQNNRRVKHFKTNYILSEKLYCMDCGSPMTDYSRASKISKVYQYYVCNETRKVNDKCVIKKLNKDMIEELVIDRIKQYIIVLCNLEALASHMVEIFFSKYQDNNEITLIEQYLKKMVNNYIILLKQLNIVLFLLFFNKK